MSASAHAAERSAKTVQATDPDTPLSETLFRARWTVDLTPVEDLVRVAGGVPERADWVEALLHGARIVDLDEPAAQVVGSPVGRSGMIGQPVAFFAPPDSWATLAQLIVEVATEPSQTTRRSSPINSFMLNGATLSVSSAEGSSSSRVIVEVEGVLRDDRSPWAVRASEQRYRRLIHFLPNALLQADARGLGYLFQELRGKGVFDLQAYLHQDGSLIETARRIVRITDANLGAANLFAAPDTDALLGPVDFLFAAAPDTARRVIIAHFEGRRSFAELMKVRTFDGRLRDVQLSVTYPTPPERLDVTLISLEDVTERLRTEAQLRQLQEDYSRAARIALLGELASSIAHEVNQPLSAIVMNAETSLRWLANGNIAKVVQLTERIAESARHASEIVQRARGMAARHAPERIPLALNEVVREALLFVQHDLDHRSIALAMDLAPALPAVLGDRVQLQQVIVNLLVNSVQAIEQSGLRRGRIALTTSLEPSGVLALSIRDNGPGIPSEFIERIFDGFFTTKADGMGIGLSVCQSIIAAHGGTISGGNAPGSGATFAFTLPPAPPAFG